MRLAGAAAAAAERPPPRRSAPAGCSSTRCAPTVAESTGVDEWFAGARPDFAPLPPPAAPWEPWGRGAILLPQAAGTDGMCMFRYRRAGGAGGGPGGGHDDERADEHEEARG